MTRLQRCLRWLPLAALGAAALLPRPAAAAYPIAFGGAGSDEVRVVRNASNGDLFVAGHFRGSMELSVNGQVRTLISSGGQDIFVARLNAAGQILWAESAGGAGSDDTVNDLQLDLANNLYITGEYYARAQFGSTDLSTVDGNRDDVDGYVAKLSVTGQWRWARGFGSHVNDTATSLVALPGIPGTPPVPDSVVVAGSFGERAFFRQTNPNQLLTDKEVAGNPAANSRDLYAARLSADGEWIWAVGRGGAATGNDSAEHLAVDSQQRVWMVGREASAQTEVFNSPLQDINDLYQKWNEEDDHLYTIDLRTRGVDLLWEADTFAPALRFKGAEQGGAQYSLPTYAGQIDANGAARLIVSIDVQRGTFDFFNFDRSDYPEQGDDLILEYRRSNGEWVALERFYGGGAQGERFNRRGAQAYVITDALAMNSNFQLRLRYLQGPPSFSDLWVPFGFFFFQSLPYIDTWHVRNVSVKREGAPRPFLLSIGNAMSSTPQLNATTPLPDAFEINDVVMSTGASGAELVLYGTRLAGIQMPPCPALSNAGVTALRLRVATGTPSCGWAFKADGGEGRAVATDSAGNVYLTGQFQNSVQFYGSGADALLASTGSNDPFILSLNASLQPNWVTGGNRFDADGIPAYAGSSGNDAGSAIGVAPSGGNVFVAGRFQTTARFGEADQLVTAGEEDGFVVTLGRDGRYPREEKWTVGVPLTPPPNARVDNVAYVPDFRVAGVPFDALGQKIFAWIPPLAGADAKLVPLQTAGGIEVRWRVKNEDLTSEARLSSFGATVWPTHACADNEINNCYQVHVEGAPVAAEPPTGEYKVLEAINPSSGSSSATYSAGRFVATRPGYAVLVYVNGPTLDASQYPTLVEVVRTMAYDTVPNFVDNVPAEIGRKIVDPYHNEPGVTGFVVNELAYYDGFGPDAAYNRTARTGTIIPVNRYGAGRPLDQGRELAVAWYRNKSKGVFWPDRAVRYAPFWPIDPPRIIIASEQGSEVLGQVRLNPANFPALSLYVQNDKDQAGYNPNDEHALMAPSALGSGFEAAFALRSDFGSKLAGDAAAASDPYVLLRYFDAASQERKFLVYTVLATGAGFNQFRYTGTAGTTVSPPYPVRLLPGCAESYVEGQAQGEQPPPPFFQDYKNQLWAKSAGGGSVHYFYPAQPGFFTDLDRNDFNEVIVGRCVPWLARLPAAEGGTASPTDPIKVSYEINWPEQTALLVSGETLLKPKRGLPNIYNQAAVEVVYDQQQATTVNPEPSDTLAQLIDPLNPRFVALSSIPSSIASQLETNGKVSLLGSADGTIKLPVSVRNRISFDPINRRLSVIGQFDDTVAGEPFLLLNVLSKRDRVALKKLDGGDGSEQENFTGACAGVGCTWDQAVEALFRKSRNPQGVTQFCTASTLNPDTRVRTCNPGALVNVTPDHVLVGYQDENNDKILEPYQATGVNAALSAGLSRGSGYLTLAFNNDASLNPLPVSLQVIQVGCLVTPPPPANALINAPYQGQVNVIAPDDIFDEQLVLRHGGDFGGNPDALEFEWYYHPDIDGTPPTPLPDPDTGQMHGWIKFPTGPSALGAVEISIEGANIQTLSDNWYVARYRGLRACQNQSKWSLYAGQPGATPIEPRAQLASGWVKRVIGRLNPFEARVQDFGAAETNNYASMLIQLGQRYSGPIALNSDPDNVNSIGLIEAYTTVMLRALSLSADATPPIDYGPANAAILLVASRLVDFYTLLGNEAYADAQDPTVAISTNGGNFSLSPSIFNFQNQLDSLLSEELVLLRGRDTANGPVAAAPVYNRLFWNFTTGDGEVAYALSYDVSDQNFNGVVDEFDARIMFPQGHGDAWGHYLTATTIYYTLLRHPFFSWDPRPEAVPVAGVPLQVDFLDERQFAETAAAKARTGAEIVDLTYRQSFVADPDGQWQGYDDTNPQRAWGLSEWGRRAGQGAYFDWVTVNAIVPSQDPNPNHVGIQKIERATISHLGEIESHFRAIQGQVDEADAGLNPLGLAQNVVSFDIDTTQLDRFNKTMFEQVYERALAALKNAVNVWDYANELQNQLRRTQDNSDELYEHSIEEETDFANQLIEIFGYPYVDDIGPGGTYPAGYEGPDLYHYMYIDVPVLAGSQFDFDGSGQPFGVNRPDDVGESDFGIARLKSLRAKYAPTENGIGFFGAAPVDAGTPRNGANGQSCTDQPLSAGCALGDHPTDKELEVEYTAIQSPDFGSWFTKPESWSGERRAPGKLQQILQQMLEARVALKQSLLAYDKLRLDIFGQQQTLQATFNIAESNLAVANAQRDELLTLTKVSKTMEGAAIAARRTGAILEEVFDTTADCVPSSVIAGLAGGGDLFSTIKCAVQGSGGTISAVADGIADGLDIVALATDAAKEDVEQLSGISTQINDARLDLYNIQGEIDQNLREEPLLRAEIYARAEAIKQLVGDYRATLAEGLRVADRLIVFRKDGAEDIQLYRFRDMAFRIFRNDALQKYRAAFDLAARYAYLAAAAYDYETNLLGGDSQSGQTFLTNIVRERNLGQILNGTPMPGSPGLADSLAQLKLNFDVLKGQMGFNNPQVETNRFSLRRELFRIPDGPAGDEEWKAKLASMRVPDLWRVPEFRRYARPFAPESAGPQPGLVIEFSTNVTFGLNFFGWDLGPNDSSYDSSQFATRVRSVGTWFVDYADLPLADDPRIYLFPVGADVLRSPSSDDFQTREWQVVDQAIPVPFPMGSGDLEDYAWNPSDTLSGSATEIRRYPRMPAYHYTEPFNEAQVTSDSRLVGRSVWNRRWVIIIPGGTFLNDPNEGLDTFINGRKIPGGGNARDGDGVDDIRIFFKTYAYAGQ